MIAIIDTGLSNIFSVEGALNFLGYESIITNKANNIENAEALILPGVGAYGPAMNRLGSLGFLDEIKNFIDNNKPVIGICLGMQLLFSSSLENGHHSGLGHMDGAIEPLNGSGIRLPHMQWNRIENVDKKLDDILNIQYFYFVHSYALRVINLDIFDWCYVCKYGINKFVAAFRSNNIVGFQFHPEKSGPDGIAFLNRTLIEFGLKSKKPTKYSQINHTANRLN